MTLDSEEEVYNFYVEYARHEGFGITKRTTKSGDDGRLKYYTLACVRGGKRRISSSQNSFNPRLSTKTDCPAKINVIVGNDGGYTISRVHLEHNHALSPQKSRFQKCNKKIDAHVKRRLELNDRAGISLSKNFHSLAVESGGYENLAYIERDCRNYVVKARQIRLGVGDPDALGAYFSCMQQRNSKKFYLVDMDDEGRLRNVFWAAALSRAAYESFGDVVSFDTTYLTNKYDMPFAPFVGVNHHGQTILFLHEAYTNEIFKLFQNELRGMLFCNLRLINSNGLVHAFQVTDIFKGKEGRFRRHICKLLIKRNAKEIPSYYILPRWRKDIKRRHTYVMNCYDDTQTNEQNVLYTQLYSHFAKLAEIGVATTGKYLFLTKSMDEAMEKLMDNGWEQEQPILSNEVHEQEQPMSSTTKFLTPLKVNSNSIPNMPNMHVDSSTTQTIGIDFSSKVMDAKAICYAAKFVVQNLK
ncbi:protein FAR-RED IMPAIRED RESPONSE 1-like [Dioscorea cayenensis subsp. rotundata]|uniref:Protein FAR-RED IMPAIRED RESPONSE 1-like n=1 Tax=Dioscorea cayennensis subsp. rotundata TaxID=55577 RepID=A0AB40AZ94_DIOCR|nr:protein FAR-RED IMPAIRED RESPONSE 1-like [Dioscorea cayenensis subsp. rotundata]